MKRRDWQDIIRYYTELSTTCMLLMEIRDLVIYLDKVGYVEAGLCGTTSMFDLVLGQSSFENPHIRLDRYAECKPLEPPKFRVKYINPMDHSWVNKKEWYTIIERGTLNERVERLLTKRLRWFKKVGA